MYSCTHMNTQMYICMYKSISSTKHHQNTVKQRNNDYKKIATEMPLLLFKNEIRMKKSRKNFNNSDQTVSFSGMYILLYFRINVYEHIFIFIFFYISPDSLFLTPLILILIYLSEESPSPVPNNDARFTFEGDEYPMEFDKCADRYVYHLHEYMYMYIYTHICIYINTYICLYLCIHIYKHITIYRFKYIP
jgi:hypothetical protein